MDLRFAHRFRVRSPPGFPDGAKVCLGIIGMAIGFASPASGNCGTPSGVVSVVGIDERLDMKLADGRLARLGGLDLPQPDRGDPETTKAAREFLAGRLTGREVELDLLDNGTDRWDRIVADFSVSEAKRDLTGASGSIALAMLQAGYARVKPEYETRNCVLGRLAIEDVARRAAVGIWRDPEYTVKSSYDTSSLRRRNGEFVVIEGRVRRVGIGSSRIYLDLAPRDGPTIVVVRKLEGAFAETGRSLRGLAGQTIRARGVLDYRFGPRLEIREPAMIELILRPDDQGLDKRRP